MSKVPLTGVAAWVAACALAFAPAAVAGTTTTPPVNQYAVSGASPSVLAQQGYDRTEGSSRAARGKTIIAATAAEAGALRAKGAKVEPVAGTTAKAARASRARAKAAQSGPLTPPTHGFDVFRPWSLTPAPCPTTCAIPNIPLRDWYHQMALRNRDVVKEMVIGRSVLGQRIMAYKISKHAQDRDGKHPAVLYDSTQHAREWIATEVERRLFQYVLEHKRDRDIKKLLDQRELWFIPVVNVDGYDYTFTAAAHRLWRKNLHDNNGDGLITALDGVDTNRNFPYKWNFDLEGAADDPSDETFHGTGPASEPEVQAVRSLERRVHPAFQIDYHSFAGLLLYPEGWQVETPNTDAAIQQALAGTSDRSAITGLDPEVGAQLYTTNGDITDDSYHSFGILPYTPELDGGSGDPVGGTDGSDPNWTPGGFVFQDKDADIQAEFLKNLDFALDLAKSAKKPDEPVSHLGNTAPDLIPTTFPASYGNPQTVEVNAKRSVGKVDVHWKVNDGREQKARTSEWGGGSRYGQPGFYYHRLRAQIAGTHPGDKVTVWFTGKGRSQSTPFTYEVKSDTGNRVLLMVAEDYTGRSSLQGALPYGSAPLYRDDYAAALQAAGVGYDVYDVDAAGRTAATNLGVLSHYKAVIWETGDDVIVRGPNQQRPGGPASGATTGTEKLFDDEIVNARDYMNEGGRLMVAGQFALEGAWELQTYNPLGATPPNPFCASSGSLGNGYANSPPGQATPCVALSDDFQQYWLGAYSANDGGDPSAADMVEAPALGSTALTLNGTDSKQNQANLYRFLTTTDILPLATYPQFKSDVAVKAAGPNPYDPPDGSFFMYSQRANQAYKRLVTTVDLTGKSSGALQFKMSSDTEPGFDFVFVEAHVVGSDAYTTLPDTNGNTSQDVGEGCPNDDPFWLILHPFLKHYLTRTGDATNGFGCDPHGTTGDWNAATGNSGGFKDWNVDLTPYAGKKVEVSITYETDPAVQGLGVFVDAAKVIVDGATQAQTSFETDDISPFSLGEAPADSPGNVNTWKRIPSPGFVDGTGIRTDRSIILGFGVEGVTGAANRTALIRDSLKYLGALP